MFLLTFNNLEFKNIEAFFSRLQGGSQKREEKIMIMWYIRPQGIKYSLSNIYIPLWNWTTFSFPRGHCLDSMGVECKESFWFGKLIRETC